MYFKFFFSLTWHLYMIFWLTTSVCAFFFLIQNIRKKRKEKKKILNLYTFDVIFQWIILLQFCIFFFIFSISLTQMFWRPFPPWLYHFTTWATTAAIICFILLYQWIVFANMSRYLLFQKKKIIIFVQNIIIYTENTQRDYKKKSKQVS